MILKFFFFYGGLTTKFQNKELTTREEDFVTLTKYLGSITFPNSSTQIRDLVEDIHSALTMDESVHNVPDWIVLVGIQSHNLHIQALISRLLDLQKRSQDNPFRILISLSEQDERFIQSSFGIPVIDFRHSGRSDSRLQLYFKQHVELPRQMQFDLVQLEQESK